MNERALRVLILTLEQLHFDSLRQIWQEHKCLHKYFVGISMEVYDFYMQFAGRDRRLTLFSEDFCEAVFIPAGFFPHWDDRLELAMSLMRRDLIDYAVYVVRQLNIDRLDDLADIVMRNGRLAALDAIPEREAVLKRICRKDRSVYISFVSDELYIRCDRWNAMASASANAKQLIVFTVEQALRHKSLIMVKWIADNLESSVNLGRYYRGRLGNARRLANAWGHAPAVELVQNLLNASK